jgi:hypothetical protein
MAPTIPASTSSFLNVETKQTSFCIVQSWQQKRDFSTSSPIAFLVYNRLSLPSQRHIRPNDDDATSVRIKRHIRTETHVQLHFRCIQNAKTKEKRKTLLKSEALGDSERPRLDELNLALSARARPLHPDSKHTFCC